MSNTITFTTLISDPDVPSLMVTTAEDTIDAQDGLISLREAINYAIADFTSGNLKTDGKYVITFDDNVCNGTNNMLTLASAIVFELNQFTATNG